MKPQCSTCNGLCWVIVRQHDSNGFQQFAKPCPVCRTQPQPVFDGKLAASGDTQ